MLLAMVPVHGPLMLRDGVDFFEDCLDNVDNRFELVLLAAKRARQLSTGGKDPLVEVESDKSTVLALREIAEGLITPDVMAREHELEAEEEFAASFETPVL